MQTNQQSPQEPFKFGSQLAWLAAGFVLPFFSLEFYLAASRKRLRSALVFFTLMMTVVSALSTARLSLLFNDLRAQTVAATKAGEFPEITIEDGTATVQGMDPFILTAEDGYFIAVDTGGVLDASELSSQSGGMLLAETELRMYNSGEHQAIPLEQYNTRLNIETIKLDGQTIVDNFNFFAITYLITSAVGLLIWNVVLWLLFLAMTTYFLYGPIGQIVPAFSFRSVLIIGIYAHLPAFVINYVLGLFGVKIAFLYTMLLMVFWVGAIYLVLQEIAVQTIKAEKTKKPGEIIVLPEAPTPLLWPAWLGLPMFVFILLNAIFTWDFGPVTVLSGLAVTIAALLLIDSIKPKDPDPSKIEK